MNSLRRILHVEDVPSIQVITRIALEKLGGFEVRTCSSAQQALDEAADFAPDLILLDVMLPDGRGIDFLRRLRSAADRTPVIILTAMDQLSDRIAGLNAGADDYLVKPFDLSELSARVAAVARRYSGNPNPRLQLGELSIDLTDRSIQREGEAIALTAREWALLEAFLQRPGALLSKSQLEERLYEFGAEIESNAVEVHVSHLRKKLGFNVVDTVRGMGYRLGRLEQP